MAAQPKPVLIGELRHALELHRIADGISFSEGENTDGTIRFLISPGDIFVSIEGGKLRCQDTKTLSKLSEIIVGARMDSPASGPNEVEMPTEPCPAEEEEKIEGITIDKPPADWGKEPQAATFVGKTVPHSIYDEIVARFGYDLLEVFGETGTLKSKGMVALALETAKAGKGVFYLDTENNLTPSEVRELKEARVQYQYTPVLSQIEKIIIQEIPKSKASLIIVDSVGMPILRKFASMSAKERGDALLDLICWLGVLKEWSFNNHSLAFVTNQPKSEFGKTSMSERGENREAFGDKGNFIPGHILLSKKEVDSKSEAKGRFVAFRSRAMAKGETVFTVSVKNGEAKIVLQEVTA